MKNALSGIMFVGLASSASAALVWTGDGDGISLYQEANWQEDDGSTLEAKRLIPMLRLRRTREGSSKFLREQDRLRTMVETF